MTVNQFYSECLKRTVNIEIALENQLIREALKARNDKRVIELLDTEF